MNRGSKELVSIDEARTTSASGFDGLVFAGGGCRCFWQAGFFHEVQPRLEIKPKFVAAASAGASLASVAIIGRAESALANFKRAAAGNPSNVHLDKLLGPAPIFPHAALFRDTILETIDAEALQSLQQGPEFRVALTRPPRSPLGLAPSLLAGLVAYQLDRWVNDRIHATWPRRLGFKVEWAQVNRCQSIEELADLLLHTSCTPPFTPALRRDGKPVIDGGLSNNVPIDALPECRRILVLLTRSYAKLANTERLVYAQPSREIPIAKWDYTSPRGLQEAFDLGRRDGENFAKAMRGEPPLDLAE